MDELASLRDINVQDLDTLGESPSPFSHTIKH